MISSGFLLLLVHALAAVNAGQKWDELYCKVPDEQLYVYRVPKHDCKCDKESEGTLRYFNKKLQICDGEMFVDVTGGPVATTVPPTPPPTTTPEPTTPEPTTPPPLGDEKNPGMRCRDIASLRRLVSRLECHLYNLYISVS